jgi:hypothetical protein
MSIFCFDIDGTLCTQAIGDYMTAKPFVARIAKVNELYSQGNIIKLFTARGSKSGIDWREKTIRQLNAWGVNYHELIFNKPHADFYVDDKALTADDFDWGAKGTIDE